VSPRLRVVSLNLASGRGADGRPRSPEELARSLEPLAALAPDVVCLQEVDAAQPRSSGADQPALVAAALGAGDWRSAAAVSGTPGLVAEWVPAPPVLRGPSDPAAASPEYGVALLVRRPVLSWHRLELGTGRGRLPLRVADPRTGRAAWWFFADEPRVAVAAVLEDGTVVAATHLSFAPVTAVRQLRRARDWLVGLPSPAGRSAVRLLAGDLNLPGGLPARVSGGHLAVRGPSFPAQAPRLQLDHVLSLGAPAAASGQVLDLPVGDHRAVLADVG